MATNPAIISPYTPAPVTLDGAPCIKFDDSIVLSSSILLSTLLPANAGVAYVDIQPETNNVRITFDGTVPTATKGILLATGQIYRLSRAEFMKALVIQVTASAKLNVHIYG